MAALAYLVLHGIRIPIHQTKQLGSKQKSGMFYCIVAIRLQITEQRYSKMLVFYCFKFEDELRNILKKETASQSHHVYASYQITNNL